MVSNHLTKTLQLQGNGVSCPESLQMYEDQLEKLTPKVNFTKCSAFVPSFMEEWVFYQVQRVPEAAASVWLPYRHHHQVYCGFEAQTIEALRWPFFYCQRCGGSTTVTNIEHQPLPVSMSVHSKYNSISTYNSIMKLLTMINGSRSLL